MDSTNTWFFGISNYVDGCRMVYAFNEVLANGSLVAVN